MKEQARTKRIRKRLELRLPVRVYCREAADFEWTEITRLVDVTPFGAGFTLKRPTERGRLLQLTIPMPRQLRVFDYVEDQYKVWALVRYIRILEVAEDKTPLFEVGVAFIGKRPPASYEKDPAQRYQMKDPSEESGAIPIKDLSPKQVTPLDGSGNRVCTRHQMAVALSLETLTEQGQGSEAESTVTENISRKGATVFTGLQIPAGRFVRVSSSEYNLSLYAVVRRLSKGTGGMPRMHLEFIDGEWPID